MFFLVRLGQTDAAFSTSVSCRRLRALWRVHEVVSDPVFSGLDLAKRVPDLDPDVASHLTRSLVYTSSERPPPPDQHDVFFQRAARSVALWKERASSDAFVAWHVYQMIPRLLADRHFALVTALVANDVVPALSSDWSHDWMSCLRHVCCAEEALEQLLRHEAASDLSYWAANPDVLTAVDLEVLAPWAHAISSASVASSRVAPKPRSPHLRRCDDRISGSGDTPVAIAWLVARRDLFTTAMAALRLPCVNVHSMSSVQRVTWHSMTQRMNGLIAAFQALSAQYREMGTLPPFDHASDQALCTWWATTAADFAAALQQRVVYLAPERGSPSLSAASRKPETSLVHRVVHAFQSLPPLPLCFLLH
ncbi:hypothetical protein CAUPRSCDRAFT_12400 [Caulochytrium protostelioides]|nr:hypothetical protein CAUPRSCDRAFT_12400 [Caulochytrium protostelioides]